AQTQWLGDSFRQSGRQVHALMSGSMARQKDSLKHFLSHYYVTREGIELTEITHHVQNALKNQANPSVTMPLLLGEDSSFNEFNH
ncbi:hypothetical protein J8J17_24525, partial [Mycobacterium tuberculosis]|nr:hypothetical protein [Mycobacterium tuberculosis]